MTVTEVHFRGWPIGKMMCILAVTLRWMFTFTGYLHLSLIAFSRYILLRIPREGRTAFYIK